MTTHYKSNTREYNAWSKMKTICYTKTFEGYKNYGGKGIRVCSKWKDDFVKFLEDMGPMPEDMNGIELINKNEDFSAYNCRWAKKSRGRKKLPKALENIKIKQKTSIKDPVLVAITVEKGLIEFIRRKAMLRSLEEGVIFQANDLIREVLEENFHFNTQMQMFPECM